MFMKFLKGTQIQITPTAQSQFKTSIFISSKVQAIILNDPAIQSRRVSSSFYTLSYRFNQNNPSGA